MLERIGVGLGLLALCAISIVRVALPPRAVPATAPDTEFSAERAMKHVREIAQRPHPMGSVDHDRVRDYIVGQLSTLGLRVEIQKATAVGTRYQEAGRVQNILARLPGTVSNGKAVLVMVHYDGVEAGPAASDDAAASAALLETLRALRAGKQPLAHDVVALFTDGEEAGLLGSAAFVREHPWAKDIAIVLNFEARGTSGRSFMFETGPGNLDAARALRSAVNATAGSVYATIYRLLPNDTDLSELAVLGLPALNFAFADGVERYHTSHDDIVHLNPGSLQHHGSQMLAMARTFGTGPLPRARTGDGVFFDLPIVGLVVYPQGLELPLAIVALGLVVALVIRERKRVGLGFVAALVTVALSGAAGWALGKMLHGPALWSGLYATAIVLLALAVTAKCYAMAKRWSAPRGLHVGALILWLVLALAISVKAPGVGYLFTWPLLFAAGAALLTRGRVFAEWVAAAVTILMLVGFTYGVSVVMLGVAGTGAIALAVVTALVALLLMPLLEIIPGNARWSGALWVAGAALVILVIAALTVHPSADHPLRSALVYAENADSSDAWLGTFSGPPDSWTRSVISEATPVPAWTARITESGRFTGRRVERVTLGIPTAVLVRDSATNGTRNLVLRVGAPAGTIALAMRARGAKVLTSSIDGRVVDTTRYRYRPRDWAMQYWSVPDGGAIVSFSIPAGSHIDFDVSARLPGIPAVPGVTIPARPPYVVPSQSGDVSVVYREWRF
ncbi:MAG TPA: M28 family peptidase [Gemmatimonadaceae bacterium]|nr:M28 family peptidase [Gemmatimonadaceae bacterium]